MKIQFLLKFGKKEHLRQLLYSGHIYIKSGEFFKQDFNHGRFDKTEGRLKLQHLKNSYIELRPKGESQWKKLNIQTGKFDHSLKISEYFIYSLYHISENETKKNAYFQFDELIKQMGDSYILIKDPKTFMNRLTKKLEENNIEFNYGIITYYDEMQNQKDLTLFHKPLPYAYQKEFRVLIKSDLKSPIEFDIGSLEDIAEILGVNDYTGFHFEWK